MSLDHPVYKIYYHSDTFEKSGGNGVLAIHFPMADIQIILNMSKLLILLWAWGVHTYDCGTVCSHNCNNHNLDRSMLPPYHIDVVEFVVIFFREKFVNSFATLFHYT